MTQKWTEGALGPLFAVRGQGTLEIRSRGTGLELLALGRVEDTLARGPGLGRALVEGLAVVIRRRVQMQRQRTGGLEWVGNSVETDVVGHVGDVVAAHDCVSLDGHGLGLLFVITVVTAQTRVSVFGIVDDLVRPVVLGLLQFAIKDLHDAVGASMVMDSAEKEGRKMATKKKEAGWSTSVR